MDHIVTLGQLTNFDEELIKISTQYKNRNDLIIPKVCGQYDIRAIKKKLQDLFSEFISARYLYQFPIDETIRVTSNYDYNGTMPLSANSSKVEKAVENVIDKQFRTTEIYNATLIVGSKLTNAETVYMINTFLKHKSEEDIAEILCISRTYLQKIKKSCVIKMWTDLKRFCNENE